MLSTFYHPEPLTATGLLSLAEASSRHIVQVLRMQPGDELQLTDGLGRSAHAIIRRADKRQCQVEILDLTHHSPSAPKLHLAVAFTRHSGRNEWLLEKITELGVHTIIPLASTRTIREKIRYDRWQNILIAAMIQSQQCYLPELTELMTIEDLVKRFDPVEQKLVAHCLPDLPRAPISISLKPNRDTLIMIGPEGDFTEAEVELCMANEFETLVLGDNRLRTETAAVAVCAFFNLINSK